MNNISRFLWYRKRGMRLRLAWYCADLPRKDEIIDFLARLVTCGCIVALLLLLTAWMDHRADEKVSAVMDEATVLKSILAKCLGDGEGTLYIDNELYLCRAIPTGVRL